MAVGIVWFQQDLRLEDHPALFAALQYKEPFIPVYIWSPEVDAHWAPGAASRWWLHHSLLSLDQQLRKLRSRLIVKKGDPLDIILSFKPTRLFWNCRYEPKARQSEEKIAKALEKKGIEVHQFHGSLLFEPRKIMTKAGTPFHVFTPFWNACSKEGVSPQLLKTPKSLPSLPKGVDGLEVDALKLLPKTDWAKGFDEVWHPGRDGALAKLKRFKAHTSKYSQERDIPSLPSVSQLSPHLHFGEISPREVWKSLKTCPAYLRQLCWREFATHLLYFHPELPEHPLDKRFEKFAWVKNARLMKAWTEGKTGCPIVDAGMRQLWNIGWMHNRVRMIVASFLTKDLLIPWLEGAKWFWDTLVDADLANNTFGWQWTAGCGADAAPFFRIFNPVLQGEKFDPDGAYVKTYVPELRNMPAKWIHKPAEAPPEILRKAGVSLGVNYPRPVVDHSTARDVALTLYKKMR